MTDRKPQVGETWLYESDEIQDKEEVEIIGYGRSNDLQIYFRRKDGTFDYHYISHFTPIPSPEEIVCESCGRLTDAVAETEEQKVSRLAKELVEEANKRVGKSCFEVEDDNDIAVDHFFTIDQFKALLGMGE